MNRADFDKAKAKILKGWAPDRVTIRDKVTILLKCQNGSYIKFALMEMPDELLNDPEVPQMTKDMLHNKLLIQWTPNLGAQHYKNLGWYIHKKEWPENEAMKEAMQEFGFRVHIGTVLA